MDSTRSPFLQPLLTGPTLDLRPLQSEDFESLYQVASDPLVWAQHPSPLRYQRPVFEEWFADAMASSGALVVIDRRNGQVIGSSRYYDWNEAKRTVAIGYTFLSRAYWGGAANAELKKLMLTHAFTTVRRVWFHVGPHNIRSQKAMAKIGAVYSHSGVIELNGRPIESIFYKMDSPLLDWSRIDTVLLDMDGTLLDLHFDNHFWQTHLPKRWLEAQGLPPDASLDDLVARFRARVGTLEWYSVDFWADELEIDIMLLKEEVAHLIAVHPHVVNFLYALRASGKRIILATNAHHKSVTLKMARTGLAAHFDAVISAHALGAAKESQIFWQRLQEIEPFDPARTLLIDDNLSVLDSARNYGIAHLLAVKKPDTRRPEIPTGDYPALESFLQLMPI